jgi:hypothetical protein
MATCATDIAFPIEGTDADRLPLPIDENPRLSAARRDSLAQQIATIDGVTLSVAEGEIDEQLNSR